MMVTRYDIYDDQGREGAAMVEVDGQWVQYADYEAVQQAHDKLKQAAREAATALMEIQYQVGLGGISNTKVRVHTLAQEAVKALAEAGIQGDTT